MELICWAKSEIAVASATTTIMYLATTNPTTRFQTIPKQISSPCESSVCFNGLSDSRASSKACFIALGYERIK